MTNTRSTRYLLVVAVGPAVVGLLGCARAPAASDQMTQTPGSQYTDTSAESRRPHGETLCYAPNWGGVVAGISTETDVLKLFGEGKPLLDGEDTSARAYSGPNHSYCVVTEFGTDRIVSSLNLILASQPSGGMDPRISDSPVSQGMPPTAHFGTTHTLKLSASAADARAAFGPAERVWVDPKSSAVHWSYTSRCACELEAGVTLIFRGEKLVQVNFWQLYG